MLSIVGPGGVGGVLAAVAKSQGVDVEVVATPRTAHIINERGLRLASTQFGKIELPVTARLEPSPGSSIIIATKAYTLPEISQVIAASRPKEILSLFNGVSHMKAVHELQAERITCGSIQIVSERIAPGEYLHHPTPTVINVEARADGWAVVSDLRRAGFTVKAGGTENEVLWRKLRFLAPMALLTASTSKPLGAALAGSEELIAEVSAIATACGLPTEPSETLTGLRNVDPVSTSSLARDVVAGNRTELDGLGYDLVRRAGQFGIETPALNEAIAKIEKRL